MIRGEEVRRSCNRVCLNYVTTHPFAPHRMADGEMPFDRNHCQNEDRRRVAHAVHEVVHFTEEVTKNPLLHQVKRDVLVDTECAHAQVGDGQIDEEKICRRPHSSIQRHDKNHEEISCETHTHTNEVFITEILS